jgi:glutaredoxin 3
MNVTIYSTPTCPYCHQAKQYLSSRQVAFTDRNVANDPRAAEEMVQRSGQRGVPVIVIGDTVIVGFDRPKIDAALAGGQKATPRLGAAVADAAKMAPKYGLGIYEGAYIGRVHAGSTAERGGVKAGDVIISLAGRPVKGADDIPTIVNDLRAGQRAPALVWRDGRQIQLELTF